jgi:hypothetical protein
VVGHVTSRLLYVIRAPVGGAAPSVSSALSVHASLFSASLDPLTPPRRSTRRDTGFPAAASRLARNRACSAHDGSAPGSGSVVWAAARRSRTEGRVAVTGGSGTSGPLAAVWSGPAHAWSCWDQEVDHQPGCPVLRPRLTGWPPHRRAAGGPVRSPWPGPGPAGRTRSWRSPTAPARPRSVAAAGGWAGARLTTRTDTRILQAAFTVLLLLVAGYTAWRALPALT